MLMHILPQFGASLVAQWERIYLQCRRHSFHPWVWKIPWRREWQPTPVFLPGKSQGQRSLADYDPWGCKRVRHDLETKQPRFFKNCKHLIFFNVRFEGLCSHEMQLGAE